MRRYAAEALGTFAVMFLGCGTALLGQRTFGPAAVALAFGLGLTAAMLAVGPVSGGHCNPAVSLAMALTGRLAPRDLLPYVAAQLAGGAAGTSLVVVVAQGRPGGDPLGALALANGFGRLSPGFYGLASALLTEVTLTALFVLVVLGVTPAATPAAADGGRPATTSPALLPLAAGVTYALAHLVGLPVTRLAMNPARALGPALLAGGEALDQLWVFLAAPLVGALLAVAVHRLLHGGALASAARASRRPA